MKSSLYAAILPFVLYGGAVFAQTSRLAAPGFEVLSREYETKILPNGFARLTYREDLRITTPDASINKSTYEIFLPPRAEKLQIEKAQVQTGETFAEVDETHLKHLIFSKSVLDPKKESYKILLPPVDKGSEIKIVYSFDWKPVVYGVFEQHLHFSASDILGTEKRIFISPVPLKTLWEGKNLFFDVKSAEDKGIFTTTLSVKAGVKPVPDASFDLFLSTAKSWRQINERLGPRYGMGGKHLPDSLARIVQSAKNLRSSQEKVEQVKRWFYAQFKFGESSWAEEGHYFPLSYKELSQLMKGNSKDFSNALAVVFRELGFKARAVLAFRAQPGDRVEFLTGLDSFPAVIVFQSALVKVEDGQGKVWWIDPANPQKQSLSLRAELLGSKVLSLDGKSDALETLPQKNENPGWLTKVEREISLSEKTGPAKMKSQWTFSLAALNEITGDSFRKIFSLLAGVPTLTPAHEAAADLYGEVGRTKDGLFLKISSPLDVLAAGQGPQFWSLGEPGELRLHTRVKSFQALAFTQNQCVLKTPWFDFERRVKNLETGMQIEDVLQVKEALAVPKEKDFSWAAEQVKKCLQGQNIQIAAKGGEGTPKGREERMQTYFTLSDSIEKTPNQVTPYVERALLLRRLGQKTSAFLESAAEDLKKAAQNTPSGEDLPPRLLFARILVASDLGREEDAMKDFLLLKEKAPKSFEFSAAGYYLNQLKGKKDVAKKWLDVARALASSEEQRAFIDREKNDQPQNP